MIDKTFQDAYQNLLKENTRLHAEKAHIVNSAQKAILNAQVEIDKLHGVISTIVDDAIAIVRDRIMVSSERLHAESDISCLAPLKINADGKEKPK